MSLEGGYYHHQCFSDALTPEAAEPGSIAPESKCLSPVLSASKGLHGLVREAEKQRDTWGKKTYLSRVEWT